VHDGRERTRCLCHVRPNLLPDAAGRGKVIKYLLTFCLVLKGQCYTRFSTSGFFYESVSPKPLSILIGPFRIVLEIHGDIRSLRCTTGVVDTGGAPSLANISPNF
jgi:hypothetical protein